MTVRETAPRNDDVVSFGVNSRARGGPEWVRETAYDLVHRQLEKIATRLDLRDSICRILRVYESICGRSLDYPLGTRPSGWSRINADGTPIQLATAVGTSSRSLQFLGEAGAQGTTGADRMRAGRACMAKVASDLGTIAELEGVRALLSELAPEIAPMLLRDPAGAFWVGAGFSASQCPQMKVYVNARWQDEKDQWSRLRKFALHFKTLEQWVVLERVLRDRLAPLGVSLTLARDAVTTGRIYLSAFGNPCAYYEGLARAVVGSLGAHALGQYARCLLGEQYGYPTPSAVCSFGISPGRILDIKLEFCCHYLFSSDIEASERLRTCFDEADVDGSEYLDLLDVVSNGRPHRDALRLHSFAGAGIRENSSYFPVYLTPDLASA